MNKKIKDNGDEKRFLSTCCDCVMERIINESYGFCSQCFCRTDYYPAGEENPIIIQIQKESYEQGFKDAGEKWEKIIRRVDAGNPKNQKSQKHNLGLIDTYSKDYILSLAEKEGLLDYNK